MRQACNWFHIQPSVYYYRPQPKDDDQIRVLLSELSILHNRWGFWMMHYHLRHLNYHWNHKKVYRIYTAMGLNLKRKCKKRLPARVMEPLLQPIHPNITWSMDFMHDVLSTGVNFRSLNIIDDYNRECLCITIDTTLNSKRVIRQLDQLVGWRGVPRKIRVDNGPEFVAQAMASWANERGIELKFIEKGKPFQNGFMERFNRSFREEVLDAYCFSRIKEAQAMAHAWMWIYNNQRPHQSLNYKPPVTFLVQHQKQTNFPTFIADEQCNWESLVNATKV
ncbi:IS3 family transposase [Mucilaginibacter sp. 22184]|uniref:IS3 family transposase n=1 Tax=Mucilaginibacter sp. 22184 TaxID=3453887 RepID=UPI003F826993